MKIRGLLLATVVLAALAGALYWSDHRNSNAEAAKPSPDAAPTILKLDENSITKLELKKKGAPAIVLAKSGSEWKITEPKPLRADQSAVSTMLSTVSSLNSERLLDEKSTDLQRYGLEHPSFELDVTETNNRTQRLLLGDDTPVGSAVYAALAGDPRLFTIAAYSRTSIDKGLNDLRDKRMLTVSADKVSRLEISGKNGDIEFGRNKDEWQILKPKPMRADSYAVGDLVSKLTDVRMDLSGSDSAAKESDTAFAHGTPIATVKVTGESSTEQLQFRKDKDTYYVKSSVVDGTSKIDSGLADAVNKKLDDFRNKKLFDFGFTDPNKVEIRTPSRTYTLLRGGQDWWDNGKKVDASAMESLLSNLRELAAEKFVDSGFTTADIEATVTSQDGKSATKVQISKSGSASIAKRDNDPTLYQLAASSVDNLSKSVDGIKPAAPPAKSGK
jgi:hypothetical protein